MIDLVIDHKWFIWEPKRVKNKAGAYYCCRVIGPKDSGMQKFGYDPVSDIIISKITDKKVYMHKGQITEYQYQNNCRELNEEELKDVDKLEETFDSYKPHWIEQRYRRKAKALLS